MGSQQSMFPLLRYHQYSVDDDDEKFQSSHYVQCYINCSNGLKRAQ
jgi:hypothetical protein